MRINSFDVQRKYSTFAQRRAVVQEFRQSGLTPTDFAAERQMTLSTLTRWLRDDRVARKPALKNAGVQFHSLALPAGPGWAAEVEQANGTLIRFQAGTPPELVAAILRGSR